jgi:putative tryptophan/tyrosine transport system substrate-binding protein
LKTGVVLNLTSEGYVRRRDFIKVIAGSAVAWPLAARAQQSMPVIGFLHSTSLDAVARFVNAFKTGLKEGGYTEGQNLVIESRFAEGQTERLPAMAAELAGWREVQLIATGGAEYPALAAKAAAAKAGIPVVFVFGGDPVKLGLVPSLARPAGHVTGIAMFTSYLESKRFGLLHEIIPAAKTVAALVDPTRAVVQNQLSELNDAASRAKVRLVVINASKESEFEAAFARAADEDTGALQVCASPNFLGPRRQLVALAARYRIPTMYEWRDFVEIGGLMSYSTDLANAYREAGVYAAKILKGTKPADLPVMQATKFEFVINLKTAKAQGVEIAPTVLARADEVIE